MSTVHIRTYGCQMNERDSEQVARMFATRGHRVTKREEEADVILINTCSVRDQAEQKALGKMGMLSRMRRERPQLLLGFMGCMAQSRGAELLDHHSHVNLVVGTQKYHRVVDHVEDILRQREEARIDDLRLPIVDTDEEPDSQDTIRDHDPDAFKPSAFVSIMQGCNMKCAFCIVPSTRGSERARPIASIVEEVRALASRGTREVTLLGQIVNLYGRHEFPAKNGLSPFVQLLEAVHDVEGIDRVRFTSPHPVGYKQDLVDAFARLPKLAAHIHLPLQSGSDRILRTMRRPYKVERFLEICDAMRAARPGLSITTDVIVGFPGETAEDFEATLDTCRRADFDNAFIFRYSKRRDTVAADMPEQLQIPESVKEERNQTLLRLIDDISAPKYRALVGTEQTVLCEGPSKTNQSRLQGRNEGNKIVLFPGDAARLTGRMLSVHVTDHQAFSLYGQIQESYL